MRTRTRVLTAAAVVVALAGGAVPARASEAGGRFVDLRRVPKPKITGAQIIRGLEDFVERFPLRQSGTPNNAAAATFLADESRKLGFRSRILEFQAGTPARPVKVVEATKRGTKKPDEWLAFVAHYDVVPGQGATIQGAYDDGSGTNMLRFFARAFSKLKTKRSIALLWFDAEENGLLASKVYAAKMKNAGRKFAAVLGFDMVGIGYPAPYCLCIYHGKRPEDAAKARPVIDYVNFDFLKFPRGDGGTTVTEVWPFGVEGHVCSCGENIRNSDEQSFSDAGYFTMRWAGMKRARDYPGYHLPWDTVQLMETVAGDRKTLEEGTENTFVSAYYTTFVLDRL